MNAVEKIWRGADGTAIPLEECTREQLIARFRYVVDAHTDKLHEMSGARDALVKRCDAHRKAKALANARADRAEAAMRAMLDAFAEGKVP